MNLHVSQEEIKQKCDLRYFYTKRSYDTLTKTYEKVTNLLTSGEDRKILGKFVGSFQNQAAIFCTVMPRGSRFQTGLIWIYLR